MRIPTIQITVLTVLSDIMDEHYLGFVHKIIGKPLNMYFI